MKLSCFSKLNCRSLQDLSPSVPIEGQLEKHLEWWDTENTTSGPVSVENGVSLLPAA